MRLTEAQIIVVQQYYDVFSYINRLLHKSLELSADIDQQGALSILSGLNTEMLEVLCWKIHSLKS